MVYPAHTRITFSGVFGSQTSPQEEWSFSLKHDEVVALEAKATRDAAVAQLRGFFETRLKPMFPSNVVLTRTRIECMAGSTVKRDAAAEYLQSDDNVVVGGALGAINMPTQIALCVSLYTLRNDASGKGRVFLPWPGWSPDVSNRLLPVDVTQEAAQRMRGLINDINGALGFGNVSVVSSKGFINPVVGVRVGRVPDTIRSRRDRRDEGYVTRTLDSTD